MTLPSATTLEEAIRDSGEGWLIDLFEPPHEAIDFLRPQSCREVTEQRSSNASGKMRRT